jgi:parallel beta-helix repeat protein
LVIANTNLAGTIRPEGYVNNIIIENNLLHDATWNVLRVNWGVTDVVIRNNEIFNGRHGGIDVKDAANASSRNRRLTITGNTIYNHPDAGIYLTDSADSLIDSNEIYAIGVGIYSAGIKIAAWDHSTPGVFLRPSNITIQRNVIHDNTGIGIWVESSDGVKVYNNTIYRQTNIPFYQSGSTDVLYMNNLPYLNKSGNVPYDPLFVNPVARDFRLCEGSNTLTQRCTGRSQAIDAGTYVGLPSNGSAIDLGALESGSMVPVTAPKNLIISLPQ